MWDNSSLSVELENAGFQEIKKCKFNDCEDELLILLKILEDLETQLPYNVKKNNYKI